MNVINPSEDRIITLFPRAGEAERAAGALRAVGISAPHIRLEPPEGSLLRESRRSDGQVARSMGTRFVIGAAIGVILAQAALFLSILVITASTNIDFSPWIASAAIVAGAGGFEVGAFVGAASVVATPGQGVKPEEAESQMRLVVDLHDEDDAHRAAAYRALGGASTAHAA